MSGTVKCIIAGVILAIIGTAVLLTGFALNDWRFPASQEVTIQTYYAQQDNNALAIQISSGTVKTEYYDGEKINIEFPSSKNYRTEITETNGTLHLSTEQRGFLWFGGFRIPPTVIKLPKSTQFEVNIEMSAGTINLGDGSYGRVALETDAGTINVGTIKCTDLSLDIDAGTVNTDGADCGRLLIDMSAGTANLDRVTCSYAKMKVSAGTVKAGFTGNREEYGIFKNISAGSCNVDSQSGTTDKVIDINISAGTVKLHFGV